MKDLVLKWNNTWLYDFWWREHYNIPFGSKRHLEISQIDIKFDYIEKQLSRKQQEQVEEDKKREIDRIQNGIWLRVNDEKEKKLIEEISLSDIMK